MTDGTPARPRKIPVVPICAAAVACAVLAYLVLRGVNLGALGARGMGLIRGAGPWAFFSAAAVLPAFGAPLTAFTIVAGDLFAPTMTLAGVIAAMFAAISVNLALTYWLARFAFRPLLGRLLGRYGYKVPSVTTKNALSVTLAFRLTPGTPFAVQSYILGLAEVPFWMYLVVSWLCQIPFHAGCVIMGKGILNGNFKTALYGLGILVVVTALVHQLRKRRLGGARAQA